MNFDFEKYTEMLDDLLFQTMQKFSIEHKLRINQESFYDEGKIVFIIEGNK